VVRIEAVIGEPRKRGLAEIGKHGKAMFVRRTNVDMPAARVAVLEQREAVEHSRGDSAKGRDSVRLHRRCESAASFSMLLIIAPL
jgi:hypothetical protein